MAGWLAVSAMAGMVFGSKSTLLLYYLTKT